MYFLHAINSDRQTRLLNVLGKIAMKLGDKKKIFSCLYVQGIPTGTANYRRRHRCFG